MASKNPDFYLTSAGEYAPLATPRGCWAGMRLSDDVRDDYMLVTISPPLIGQPFGLGDRDIDQLVIASRLQGYSLYPTSEWPVPVYVARILDDTILQSGHFRKEQVQLVAWGLIFNDPAAAQAEAARFASGRVWGSDLENCW